MSFFDNKSLNLLQMKSKSINEEEEVKSDKKDEVKKVIFDTSTQQQPALTDGHDKYVPSQLLSPPLKMIQNTQVILNTQQPTLKKLKSIPNVPEFDLVPNERTIVRLPNNDKGIEDIEIHDNEVDINNQKIFRVPQSLPLTSLQTTTTTTTTTATAATTASIPLQLNKMISVESTNKAAIASVENLIEEIFTKIKATSEDINIKNIKLNDDYNNLILYENELLNFDYYKNAIVKLIKIKKDIDYINSELG